MSDGAEAAVRAAERGELRRLAARIRDQVACKTGRQLTEAEALVRARRWAMQRRGVRYWSRN